MLFEGRGESNDRAFLERGGDAPFCRYLCIDTDDMHYSAGSVNENHSRLANEYFTPTIENLYR